MGRLSPHRLTCALVASTALLVADSESGRAEQSELVPLTAGMVVERSITLRPGRYELASSGASAPALRIRGDNVTVDFNGAELAGGAAAADPDTFTGIGVLIEGGTHITLKNAVIRGYKVALLARDSPDLHLTGNDFSYNWKPRLYSGIEKESLVDWMSYHQNDKDEWLRYGAGIYLSRCDRAEVDRNIIVQGQNGLMATRSSNLKVWNNTFQFLSGIGAGLYRVTNSTIAHNRIDWCVRGYSHGFYNRGQDSAGLLMYEQSSGNRVVYNSITHGGDGVFLWAGQSTMDTGQGGANDNYFYGNDFSHAPANGIEATFSRNTFVANRVEECWHGVWGGYSWDSKWISNRFARNTEGIAIEHGQNNEIVGNTFDRDETAIRLWQNATQDPNWGYPKHRDTRSRNYLIALNRFFDNKLAVDLRDSRDVTLQMNAFRNVAQPTRTAGAVEGLLVDPVPAPHPGDPGLITPPPGMPGGVDPMIKDGERRGRQYIIVDEWGPYDWKSPKLWPTGRADERPLRLRVLGPEGAWTVARVRGATIEPQRGRVPGEVVVTPSGKGLVGFDVVLEYRGAAVTSPRGERTAAGAAHQFAYQRFFAPIPWTVRFFEYGAQTDPLAYAESFRKLITGTPLKITSPDRLDYLSGRNIEEGVPRDRFALTAEGTVDLPAGEYVLRMISDDGARMWVDGKLVIDAWAPHESRVDEARIDGGRRRLRVEYYEVEGFAELRVDVQPRRSH
jgi:nitrous oxidase accessory protein NosD